MQIDPHSDLCKSGWLKKKSGLMWKKVYCELHQTELYVRKNDHAQKINTRIPISANTDIKLNEDKKKSISVSNEGSKTYYFRCSDEDEIVKWFLELRSATFHNALLSMDDFDILSVLGRGYFGKVMLVKKKKTQDLFAIKTVHKMRLVQSKKVHTMLAERNIMRKIKHPFIVDLLFAFQSATKFYLGLEYIPGGELFQLIRKQAVLPLPQVRQYIAEVGLALDHLHKVGIVYRDLKPENILINTDGHLKLTDFGLAKDIGNETTRTFCGTADFLAPEIIEKHAYSFTVDWWALGILTYELLFGRCPFYDENRTKMFSKISLSEPVFPPNADPNVVDFIKKLLTKSPQTRPTFEDLIDHPFWEGLKMDDVMAKSITPVYIPEITDPSKPIYFDEEFTNENAIDSIATPAVGDKNVFRNFSFVENNNDSEDEEIGETKDFPQAQQIIAD